MRRPEGCRCPYNRVCCHFHYPASIIVLYHGEQTLYAASIGMELLVRSLIEDVLALRASVRALAKERSHCGMVNQLISSKASDERHYCLVEGLATPPLAAFCCLLCLAQDPRSRSRSASRRRFLFCPSERRFDLASACPVYAPLSTLFLFLAPAARALSRMDGRSRSSSFVHTRIIKCLDSRMLSCFLVLQRLPIVLSLFVFRRK